MTRPLALLTLLVIAAGGCAEGLHFRTDERLRFLSPPDRSLVSGPVLVRWDIDASEFQPVGADGSRDPSRGFFGVFVDRPPMRPGESLTAVSEDDPYCRAEAGCPDRQWLAQHGVHLTRRPWVALRALRRDGGQDLGDTRRHEVIVVLLDGRGVRIGESAWALTLFARGGDA